MYPRNFDKEIRVLKNDIANCDCYISELQSQLERLCTSREDYKARLDKVLEEQKKQPKSPFFGETWTLYRPGESDGWAPHEWVLNSGRERYGFATRERAMEEAKKIGVIVHENPGTNYV